MDFNKNLKYKTQHHEVRATYMVNMHGFNGAYYYCVTVLI